jgi:hypothetical protein
MITYEQKDKMIQKFDQIVPSSEEYFDKACYYVDLLFRSL